MLAYEFLNFATSGLFIGARHVYLSIHNDDLFFPNTVWDPTTSSDFPEEVYSYRLMADEVPIILAEQDRFRASHPLASQMTLELAFHGEGADIERDPLTAAVVAASTEFGFINHTYSALDIDWVCPETERVPAACAPADVLTATNEMTQNAVAWQRLGLPGNEHALAAVVTSGHTGLNDRRGTPETTDDVPFPQGFSQALGIAAEILGVRVLASDVSQLNQDRIQRVPGYGIVLLPRYPTSIFYNTTNPRELVSEYNHLFYYRHLEAGVDPCSVAGALCAPRSYDEILTAEAETTLAHLLAFQPFPHYFHQSNLRVYDESRRTLQFDWLNRALEEYERVIKLPIASPRFHELAALAWRLTAAREARPEGWVDTATGLVTLSAQSEATIEVTGLAGGRIYGGQRTRELAVSPVPATFALDAALDL